MTSALRRARPLLGTLVEVGAYAAQSEWHTASAQRAIDAAFAEIAAVQTWLSRFNGASDIGSFNALAAGGQIVVHAHTQAVLRAATRLRAATQGAFDISLGTGAGAWELTGNVLHKHSAGVRLDLGGIGKGHAVDQAVRALQAHGCGGGWVNAGGDLRAFGSQGLALHLRDEAHGGARPWGQLRDGACATSHYAAGSRSALSGESSGGSSGESSSSGAPRHLSVLAEECLWADALTKVAALGGHDAAVREFGGQVVWH